MRQQSEASVEEILESIKKVIARDNRAGAAEERRQRESDGIRHLATEMTREMMVDTTSDTSVEPADADEADEVLDLGTADFAEEEPASDGFDDSRFEDDHDDDDIPLTAEPVRDSMRENFAALAMLSQPGAAPQIVRSGETSLEGLVRDMLRPMLSEWLDSNLPSMVEKMVQAEIARIAGKRG